jgi:hypothetical protein
LILVGGLPSTGKSSLASALADRLGCSVLGRNPPGRPSGMMWAWSMCPECRVPRWTG